MKALIVLACIIFCFHISVATPLPGLEKFRKVPKKEIGGLNTIIQSGTVAALNLAAADDIIDSNAAARYQVDDVRYVSKFVNHEENLTRYFAVVKTIDKRYHDMKVVVGFLIDQDNRDRRLTIKAYKIGAE